MDNVTSISIVLAVISYYGIRRISELKKEDVISSDLKVFVTGVITLATNLIVSIFAFNLLHK